MCFEVPQLAVLQPQVQLQQQVQVSEQELAAARAELEARLAGLGGSAPLPESAARGEDPARSTI